MLKLRHELYELTSTGFATKEHKEHKEMDEP
jgi:hypothetical protein